MNRAIIRARKIQHHLDQINTIVLEYIRIRSTLDRTPAVSTVAIRRDLELNHFCNPKNKCRGHRGWLLGIVLRQLEDEGLIEIDNFGSRTFVKLIN